MDLEALGADTEEELDSDVVPPLPGCEGGAFFSDHPQVQDSATSEDLDMVMDVVTHSSEYPEVIFSNLLLRVGSLMREYASGRGQKRRLPTSRICRIRPEHACTTCYDDRNLCATQLCLYAY